MKNLDFRTRDSFDKYIDKHFVKELGLGGTSRCVLLDTDVAAKIYNSRQCEKDVLEFKDVYIPSFQFARAVARIKGNVYASFAEPASGKDLRDRWDYLNNDMVMVGNQLDVLARDILTLTELGIQAEDFFVGNIVYDNEKFTVIDTRAYFHSNEEDLKNENFDEIMKDIYNRFLSRLFYENRAMYGYKYSLHKAYLETPGEYFKELRDYIRMITDTEVVTFNEASIALERIKKRDDIY